MHSQIPQHHKNRPKHRQPHTIHPQRLDIEPETAEDGGAGDLDVDAVFVVGEGEVFHLIDDESFEGEVEYRELDGWVTVSFGITPHNRMYLVAEK